MEEKRSGSFIFLLVGLLGSVFFAFAGYLIGGALGVGLEKGIGFINGLFVVLANPFDKYFNKFTPITILLGFILFETIYILFLFFRKKEEPLNEEEYKPDIIDLVDIDGEAAGEMDKQQSESDEQRLNASDKNMFGSSVKQADSSADGSVTAGIVQRDFVAVSKNNAPEPKKDNSDSEILDEKLSFGSEIMDEMLGEHYTLDQMVAMINIKKYMKDVSADLLKRMFSPDMSPDEITSYISIFYE